jgi:asparagine synthase (glutamine-hydrolysing)
LAVVPLSGGNDSRVVLSMLKRLGYDNVVTFTYGRRANWESQVSQAVAEQLGFPWHFVPYTRRKWYEWWESTERHAFCKLADGLSSLPHPQDFPATWELQRSGLLPDDAVFIPGHGGDSLTGGRIPSSWMQREHVTGSELAQAIFRKNFRLWPSSGCAYRPEMLERIRRAADVQDRTDVRTAVSRFDRWDWRERQSKYINNSVRVYEFWGYDWRLPLWDDALIDFWSGIPDPLRIGRNLYVRYCEATSLVRVPAPTALRSHAHKGFDRYLNPIYGRYDGARPWHSFLFMRVGDIVDLARFPVVRKNRFVRQHRNNALGTIQRLAEIEGQ